jgi:hypothetical protein
MPGEDQVALFDGIDPGRDHFTILRSEFTRLGKVDAVQRA